MFVDALNFIVTKKSTKENLKIDEELYIKKRLLQDKNLSNDEEQSDLEEEIVWKIASKAIKKLVNFTFNYFSMEGGDGFWNSNKYFYDNFSSEECEEMFWRSHDIRKK